MEANVGHLFNTLFAILFYLAAFVQLNDPDPMLWVTFYLTPAILCSSLLVLPSRKDAKLMKISMIIVQAVCVLMSITLAISIWSSTTKTTIHLGNILDLEEGRELGGTILVFVWVSTQRWISNENQRNWYVVGIAVVPLLLWGVCHVDWLATRVSYCKSMQKCQQTTR